MYLIKKFNLKKVKEIKNLTKYKNTKILNKLNLNVTYYFFY